MKIGVGLGKVWVMNKLTGVDFVVETMSPPDVNDPLLIFPG